ncbi:ribonuclease J [Sphaerobacter thermophilus]|uniref:Ribonuclease J n=1 Tax=Sphaerobacter thermophilus (strain ATCC 49802 / DSM 20745 / KCCM 41009 / NCIMB 13125 / S 6022) TaxID=479434 RepID=D1C2B3_SPHTD|nr:ribonuclease J [Sphaerobacter thermophilus]ACZ38380.1 beta-lactamase domain protein [Sphaerobacter thermophilus DSM 20745]
MNNDHHLDVTFLGGLGEVGKNMLVLASGDDMIVIDAGVGFPEEDMFGVDLLLPDITYLRQNADRVRGIFITHGHEDHIGALAYLLEAVNAPVYSTRLTQGLLRNRLRERKMLDRADLRLIVPEEDPRITAGCFTVECFRVSHSIPDAVGFAIETPVGLVVHTGDFKFDQTPVDGRLTDMAKLGELGRREPLLLISDCVHVESPGTTPSERVVEQTFDDVMRRASGRVIVATFASNISRVQQVLTTAHRHGRRVACVGRSLQNNVRVALELGYLTPPPDTLIRVAQAAKLPPEQVVYVCTGSQGEPMAVLSRIARGDHKEIRIQPGDTVVISATPIPGNESSVYRLINQLFKQGAEVIYAAHAPVHVSGHASQDELRMMLNLVRPRFVLPFHGEPRHLYLYADLARSVGIPDERIMIGEVGTVFRFDGETAEIVGSVPSGTVYVDGLSVGEAGDKTIVDRRLLARDGVLLIVVTIDRESGQVVAGPEIVGRGFLPDGVGTAFLTAARDHLSQVLGQNGHTSHGRLAATRAIHETVQSFVYQQTRRRPVILPVVLEV